MIGMNFLKKYPILYLFLLSFLCIFESTNCVANYVWAINCGGDAHVDIHGIHYQKDNNPVGISSDYGKSMLINRVPREDQVIYQTERYNTANLVYDVPIQSDGEYILVLKFSEVWFTAPNQKVFDVMLNSEHVVVERLDIFNKVGRGTAHDEIIPFRVKDGKLYVKEESSDLYYKKIQVELIKGDRDNPKVNAIVLFKGSVDDVPRLAPFSPFQPDSEESHRSQQNSNDEDTQTATAANYRNDDPSSEYYYDDERSKSHGPGSNEGNRYQQQYSSSDKNRRKKVMSGPKSPDPYSTDDTSSMFFPLAVAIGAFLPILFCLCKL